ncbi:MAG: hypothetical protein ABR518_00440 [Actinomycetota bacterium]
MSEIPERIREMAAQREEARRRRDFAGADAIRDRIRAAGFEIVDAPDGSPVLSPVEEPRRRRFRGSAEVPRAEPDPEVDCSVVWLTESWPGDVGRGIASFRRHHSRLRVQHVVVVTDGAGAGWPEDVEVIDVDPSVGWSALRNAGLRRAAGRIVAIADGSIEAEGDVLTALAAALDDPSVGLAGPFGVVSRDLREFQESPGPDVDAIEAYLIAGRRDVLGDRIRFDERFMFYRSADLELSFQAKALGLRCVVVPGPVGRHVHRTWEATPDHERRRLSKRNFYRFLDRWRSRSDLLEANGRGSRRDGIGEPPGRP